MSDDSLKAIARKGERPDPESVPAVAGAVRRVVITGATSGLGRALAERFIMAGWTVGAAGRNAEALAEVQRLAPSRVMTMQIDVCRSDAPARLMDLANLIGGMDIYLHCPGILLDNDEMNVEKEVKMAETNAVAMCRMTSAAFRYFRDSHKAGRIVAISSVAGCRGLGDLPAYSASKAFCQAYLEALRQKADALHLPLRVVDIRPGWTRTPLLDSHRTYIMEMPADRVADLIFHAALHARRVATIGLRWKILTSLERMLPACLWEKIHLPLWKDV